MPPKPHQHGGQLQAACERYQIPLSDWIDLSTGISPFTYPLPTVPEHCWQRLPEANDGLETAAASYYGSPFLLPLSGSQEAIQRLPRLLPAGRRIGIIKPAYHSHQQAWQRAGHQVRTLSSHQVDQHIAQQDVLIVVNPTNPTAQRYTPDQLMDWHQKLARQAGWLIVDEAFIDATPENSLIQTKPVSGLIVLRSIGKFFGLAGIRLGFIWAEDKILQSLAQRQDDWSVSHPSRWAGTLALQDTCWQAQQRQRLAPLSRRLALLLEKSFQTTVRYSELFAYLRHKNAEDLHQQLAHQGILTRDFNDPPALRFGIPPDQQAWERLEHALF